MNANCRRLREALVCGVQPEIGEEPPVNDRQTQRAGSGLSTGQDGKPSGRAKIDFWRRENANPSQPTELRSNCYYFGGRPQVFTEHAATDSGYPQEEKLNLQQADTSANFDRVRGAIF
jgi:hypothetical protein